MKKMETAKISLLLIIFTAVLLQSHPIHITETYLYINHDYNNEKLPENIIIGKTVFNWQQAAIIVELESRQKISDPEQLKNFSNEYLAFIQNHLTFLNKGKHCGIAQLDPPTEDPSAIILKDGIAVWFTVTADAPFATLKIHNTMFTDNNEIQENGISIMDGTHNTLLEDILTEKKKEIYFNLYSPQKTSSPANIPGEKKKESFLEKLTSEVFTTSEKSLYLAVILVFLLGLLHTLEAGHSKLIISSYMLNKHVTIKNGLFYASVFTLTHIADIIILGIVLICVNSFVDIYEKMAFLQTFSIYALFFIALYLLFRNTAQYVQTVFIKKSSPAHSHDHAYHDHEHDHLSEHDLAHAKSHGMTPGTSLKEQLILGFVTGLSPCLMGWSIFMMILSTRNLWSLFPIIISFGLGIFLALSLLVVVIGKSRKMFYGRFTVIQELSPVISSLLLLGFATMLLL